jgi:hypothetical protein
MGFADDGVFRDAHAAADFRRRMAFSPKRPQPLDDLVCPIHL